MRIILSLLTGLLPALLFGQINFTNSNALLTNNNSGFNSGVAIAIADINGDGLDDLVRLNQGRVLTFDYQNPDGSFTQVIFGQVSNSSQWMIAVADVNNDGFGDIMTGGAYDGIKFIQSDANGVYTQSNLPSGNMFAQAANFADINNDGWIDAFVCHDDAESRIWGNDGAGNLVPANDWINMATVPASDNSGNYGSVWTDFDNDGDLDLYIAKCRQGVNNPTDPRRINALFVNDGNGNFTEAAETYGLKIGAQSWSVDFADIDNDGDMDCFITNHDVPSMLLINDGNGYFTDITAGSGLNVAGLPIQCIFRDFDNDGFVDLLISGTKHYIYRNNGDLTFTEVPAPFNLNQMESFAVGDLNHDGFVDIYAGYANIYTSPSNIDDVLWLNQGNNNNFVAVNLTGVQSNRNAIGARLELYGEWGIQIREVRAGESYGIMNAFSMHFGLGTSTEIDSLVVRWPSGHVDVVEAPAINQFINLIENGCVSPNVSIQTDGPLTICSGQTVTLTATSGYNQYNWSNGASTQSIFVGTSGTYQVLVTDENGCDGNSLSVTVVVDPIQIPGIQALGDTQLCVGESVVLEASAGNAYLWPDGSTEQTFTATESGLYTVQVLGLCDYFESPEIEVVINLVDAPVTSDVYLVEPGIAELFAAGENILWYDAPTGGTLLSTGNMFETPFLDADASFYAETSEEVGKITEYGGMPAHTGGSQYGGDQFNGDIRFDALQEFILKSVLVYTDTEAERRIVLLDSGDNLLDFVDVFIPVGEHTIEINLPIPAQNGLKLTTDVNTNQINLGIGGPRLRRNNSGVNYPYVIEDVVSVNNSLFGPQYYYYFYNWEIELPGKICSSERAKAQVFVQPVSVKELNSQDGFRIFPNPSASIFTLDFSAANLEAGSVLELRDAAGRLLERRVLPSHTLQHQLDMSGLPSGWYYVRIPQQDRVLGGRLLKQ
jgi:hypothetical protein